MAFSFRFCGGSFNRCPAAAKRRRQPNVVTLQGKSGRFVMTYGAAAQHGSKRAKKRHDAASQSNEATKMGIFTRCNRNSNCGPTFSL